MKTHSENNNRPEESEENKALVFCFKQIRLLKWLK